MKMAQAVKCFLDYHRMNSKKSLRINLRGRGRRLLFACARPLQGMEAPENAPAVQRHIELMRIEVETRSVVQGGQPYQLKSKARSAQAGR
jgi:hypothetical protein